MTGVIDGVFDPARSGRGMLPAVQKVRESVPHVVLAVHPSEQQRPALSGLTNGAGVFIVYLRDG